MTSPVNSLPFPIKELMTNVTVLWEQAAGTEAAPTRDVYGQPSYAAPVQINCWMEPEGMGMNAGMTDSRATFNQAILQQTRRPELSLYFDGDDPNAQQFKMLDRFTPPTTGGADIALMPTVIETLYGPNFDNQNPWLIRVGF